MTALTALHSKGTLHNCGPSLPGQVFQSLIWPLNFYGGFLIRQELSNLGFVFLFSFKKETQILVGLSFLIMNSFALLSLLCISEEKFKVKTGVILASEAHMDNAKLKHTELYTYKHILYSQSNTDCINCHSQ